MQPLKMVIPGKFYDSQIYSGRLYLFGRQKDITTIEWEELIKSIRIKEELKLALVCGFERSDYLYNSNFSLMYDDFEIKKVITKKFEELSRRPILINVGKHTNHKQQDNPFEFPHADCEIYSHQMYVGGKSGVLRSNCSRKNVNPVSTKTSLITEMPAFGIACGYKTLLVSTGETGLQEIDIEKLRAPIIKSTGYNKFSQERGIPEVPSFDCGWAFYSEFSSDNNMNSYLAEFQKIPDGSGDKNSFHRKFDGISYMKDVFEKEGYCYASQDKIYQFNDSSIRVVKYKPWNWEETKSDFGTFDLESDDYSTDIVSTAITVFGVVIEYEKYLLVVNSDSSYLKIDGEPVNWRVFPRSKFYENQLHVVFDDRVEIYSFNHDYFVDQKAKSIGTEYFNRDSFSKGRSGKLSL